MTHRMAHGQRHGAEGVYLPRRANASAHTLGLFAQSPKKVYFTGDTSFNHLIHIRLLEWMTRCSHWRSSPCVGGLHPVMVERDVGPWIASMQNISVACSHFDFDRHGDFPVRYVPSIAGIYPIGGLGKKPHDGPLSGAVRAGCRVSGLAQSPLSRVRGECRAQTPQRPTTDLPARGPWAS